MPVDTFWRKALDIYGKLWYYVASYDITPLDVIHKGITNSPEYGLSLLHNKKIPLQTKESRAWIGSSWIGIMTDKSINWVYYKALLSAVESSVHLHGLLARIFCLWFMSFASLRKLIPPQRPWLLSDVNVFGGLFLYWSTVRMLATNTL